MSWLHSICNTLLTFLGVDSGPQLWVVNCIAQSFGWSSEVNFHQEGPAIHVCFADIEGRAPATR